MTGYEYVLKQMYLRFLHKFNGDKEKAKKAVYFILNQEKIQKAKYDKFKQFYKNSTLIPSKARKPYGDYREFQEEITRYLYNFGGELKSQDFKKIFNIDELIIKKKKVYSIFVDDSDENMYFTFYDENNNLCKHIFYITMFHNDNMIEQLDRYLFKCCNDNEFGEHIII